LETIQSTGVLLLLLLLCLSGAAWLSTTAVWAHVVLY
jgi:hypothetical protein